MRLSDAAVGRDNNFNLIRFIAAFMVLISHSFAVVLGAQGFEPLERALGYTLGEIAVDMFFASSGFLVTGSLLRLGNIRNFGKARALRIYPGLAVAVCLTVFVLGPMVSTVGFSAYLLDPATLSYLARNSTLVTGIQHTLPGVFAGHPLAGIVNGSLWTLPFELAAYFALAATWIVHRRLAVGERSFALLLVAATLIAFVLFHASRLRGLEIHHVFRLFFMFFGGGLLYALKQHVRLDWRVAAFLTSVVGFSALHAGLFIWLYPPCVAYLTLFAAYAPGKAIRGFNRLGDYSYGIYIYAFPVQQAVISLSPQAGVPDVIAWTSLFTLLLAYLSWHAIEKPALSRKDPSGSPKRPLGSSRSAGDCSAGNGQGWPGGRTEPRDGEPAGRSGVEGPAAPGMDGAGVPHAAKQSFQAPSEAPSTGLALGRVGGIRRPIRPAAARSP